MTFTVFDLSGIQVSEIETDIFQQPIRTELILRAFNHLQSHSYQPKGRYPRAGRDTSAEFFGTGLGLARVPRIKNPPHRGRAAIVTMAVGGRRPHVETPNKVVSKRLNRKERSLATASAAAATADRLLVAKRGHLVENVASIPLVVADELEEVLKTGELMSVADALGLSQDIVRAKHGKKTTGGKASMRGRRRRYPRGPLIVYGSDRGIWEAARNIPGLDCVAARNVSVIHLAPGGVPGRLTVWTSTSLEILSERLADRLRRLVTNV
ncbi:MAG: 50S ribosomal protein L4 [Candidatus Geothermarchaeales archaeon]